MDIKGKTSNNYEARNRGVTIYNSIIILKSVPHVRGYQFHRRTTSTSKRDLGLPQRLFQIHAIFWISTIRVPQTLQNTA